MNLKSNQYLSLIFLFLFLFVCFVAVAFYSASEEYISAKVLSKKSNRNVFIMNVVDTYQIQTDKEEFVCKSDKINEYFFGDYNSEEIYNKLQVGKYYKFKVVSWRCPLFSVYRSIIQVKEIDVPAGGKGFQLIPNSNFLN
jgi:hypothetical protein